MLEAVLTVPTKCGLARYEATGSPTVEDEGNTALTRRKGGESMTQETTIRGRGNDAGLPAIRIPPLPREQWTDAAREVFAYWGEPGAWDNGSRTNSQMVLANHPTLAMAFNKFGRHILIENSAPACARELVTLRIAWHMRSQYE